MDCWDVYESPIGPLTLVMRGGALRGLHFPRKEARMREELRDPAALAEARGQLEEYFAGQRRAFDLPLEPLGPPLLREVWAQLLAIPYGETVSYGELARRLGRLGPEDPRRVGAAVGRTPLPILIPCHRVIGANGDLTGYGGGLQRKQALLDLEASVAAGRDPEPAWSFRQLALG